MTVFLAPDGPAVLCRHLLSQFAAPRHAELHQILESVHDLWLHRRDDLLDQAQQLTDAIGREGTRCNRQRRARHDDVLARRPAGAAQAIRRRRGAASGRRPQVPASDVARRSAAPISTPTTTTRCTW